MEEYIRYVVRSGDTLAGICAGQGVGFDSVFAPLSSRKDISSDRLMAGDVLYIRAEREMFTEEDLDKIYIRATDKEGKWGSFSLKELYDMKEVGQIQSWFLSKISQAMGVEKGELIKEEHLVGMVNVLERLGVTIYKSKE